MTNEEFLIEAIVKAGCEEYGGSSECSGDCFRYCKNCKEAYIIQQEILN